jgi:hypothetical protein
MMEILSDILLPRDPDAALEAATKQYVDSGGASAPVNRAWMVLQPGGIGFPPDWPWGAGGETWLTLNVIGSSSSSGFSNPSGGGGGYGTDILTSTAGPHRITAHFTGNPGVSAFWIISCALVRAGAVVVQRDCVTGANVAGEWTTASFEHIFDAQAGDKFRISCNSGGSAWTLDNRSYVTIERIVGMKGDVGPTGPTGPAGGGGGYAICTSTTRPASPSDGTFIYETDTKLRYFSDGGQWYLQGEQVIARAVTASAVASFGVTLPVVANAETLRIVGRLSTTSSQGLGAAVRFNGDTGANYARQSLYGIAATPGSAVSVTQTSISMAVSSTYWAMFDMIIPGYTAATRKPVVATVFDPRNLATPTALAGVYGGEWNSTAPITSVEITVGNTFVVGSTLTCYASSTLG